MTSSGLFFTVTSTATPAAGDARVRVDVLARLVELYGRELAPVLYAIGWVESRWNPSARNLSDVEDSRGVFQVNTKAWGVAAAGELGDVESQMIAARPVVDDAEKNARALVDEFGVHFEDAFSLVWNYGAPRAKKVLSRAGSFAAGALSGAMGAAGFAAWKARDKAFRAAFSLAVGALSSLYPLAAGGVAILLVVGLALASDVNRRRKGR